MKTKGTFLIFVLISIFLSFSGCKKDNEEKLTEAQKQEIMNSYNLISEVADQALLAEDPLSALSQHLDEFKTEPGVENVWISGNTMFVKFTKGSSISWIVANDYVIPPYIGDFRQVVIGIPVGNGQACLINQVFNDEDRPICVNIIYQLHDELINNRFEVTEKNGEEANVIFFLTNFKKYGAIFYISHGYYDGTHTWLVTGEEANDPKNKLMKLLHDYLMQWLDGEITIGHCRELRNAHWKFIPYYAFSEKFINNAYQSSDFPNSLIYLVACQSFKSTNQLAEAFHSKGAGVTIGWNETDCLGPATGKLLFDILLGGSTVGEAFDALPAESKIDNCAVSPGAELVYYPPSGRNISLTEKKNMNIIITSLENGHTYSDRVQNLDGYVEGIEQLTSGTVEINGITVKLEIISSTEFSQPFLMINGNNTLKVNCIGKKIDGTTASATTEINVTGDLVPLDLFTELRWNTNYSDVDLHLLPPGADMYDLWTTDDCFYDNMDTYWGGSLDIDDVEGYGPEHITIPTVSLEGTYRLFVHYYDEDGAGKTQAFFNVSTLNGPLHDFGPYTLIHDGGNDAGDIWEVCKIEYPGGNIIPVNEYHYLGVKKSNSYLPGK